jgi:hypothetical protein
MSHCFFKFVLAVLANLLVLVCLIDYVNCRDVCYEGYGCFTDKAPFGGVSQRPFALLPDRPERINTKFTLYNRKSMKLGQAINSKLFNGFNASLSTKFIIHGFLHHGNKEWILAMKDAILNVDDVNVIAVDWSDGNGLVLFSSF